ESGNASVARVEGERAGWCVEAVFVAEPTVDRTLRADRFFPPTPLRVVVDASGEEVDLPVDRLRGRLAPIDPRVLTLPDVARRVPELVEEARRLASARGPAVADAARARMHEELGPLVDRLVELH